MGLMEASSTSSEPTSLTQENLGFLLAKASQHWNELLHERFVGRGYGDVRPAYGSILVPLLEEDGLRIGELASRARLAKQTMTTMIRLLERADLVRRERDPDDGRASRVYLMARSQRFRAVVQEVLTDLDELVASRLTANQRAALPNALKEVIDL